MVVYSVCQVTQYIKSMFAAAKPLAKISIRGEIANFKRQASGHLYFSIKDANSQLKAIMFASNASRLDFRPSDGMRVIIECSISVYEKGGVYQAYVSSMQPDGIGALYLAYEKLKEQLQKEGLFAAAHKKPLPNIPCSIGVITSPTGAAVRDIINITGRRWPQAELYLYPSRVQGEGAEDDLLKGLAWFESKQKVDVIIIGRGGGSMEDLWVFNSERLARKIYAAETPIVSAVGHETDFTICDLVADCRAPTPSAAAELVVPDRGEMYKRIESYKKLIDQKIATVFSKKKKNAAFTMQTLQSNIKRYLIDKKHELQMQASKLQAINPLAVLARGYSIAEKQGKIVSSAGELQAGDELWLRFQKGRAQTIVQRVEEE